MELFYVYLVHVAHFIVHSSTFSHSSLILIYVYFHLLFHFFSVFCSSLITFGNVATSLRSYTSCSCSNFHFLSYSSIQNVSLKVRINILLYFCSVDAKNFALSLIRSRCVCFLYRLASYRIVSCTRLF